MVQISIGIAAFAYQDAIKVSFKNGLKNSMKNYRNVEANQDAVDTMQATVSQTWQNLFLCLTLVM